MMKEELLERLDIEDLEDISGGKPLDMIPKLVPDMIPKMVPKLAQRLDEVVESASETGLTLEEATERLVKNYSEDIAGPAVEYLKKNWPL